MQPNRTLALTLGLILTIGGAIAGGSQSAPAMPPDHAGHPRQTAPRPMSAEHSHPHGTVPAISFAELKHTAEQLEAARHATEKYQDVHTAEAGYWAIGPDVPGMVQSTIDTSSSASRARIADHFAMLNDTFGNRIQVTQLLCR